MIQFFGETENIVAFMKKPRNRYINEAIAFYNKHHKQQFLERKLKKESDLVKDESMNILNEFEDIDYAD